MGERTDAYTVLVRKPAGMRPLGEARRRWKNNIKMDLQEIVWRCGLDRSGSGQGQVAGSCDSSDGRLGSII
jgi:hypothetical protein